MTNKGSTPKRHHYIPKGILKNFTKSGSLSDHLFWFSKKRQIIQSQIPDKTGFIRYFYDYSNSEKSLESVFFSKIDDDGATIINEIIENESIKSITSNSDKKTKLIKYIATQKLRIPEAYEHMLMIENLIKEEVHPEISIINNEDIKNTFLDGIIKNTAILEAILKEKIMTLHMAENKREYIIGDTPVLSFNKIGQRDVFIASTKFPFLEKNKIYLFPISHRFMISFIDNDISLIKDFLCYMRMHNEYQFAFSNDFVFAPTKKILEIEKEKYNSYAYEVIKNIKPELIKHQKIKKGDSLTILPTTITLSEGVRTEMLELYLKSKK